MAPHLHPEKLQVGKIILGRLNYNWKYFSKYLKYYKIIIIILEYLKIFVAGK